MLSFPVDKLSAVVMLTLLCESAAALSVGAASIESQLGAPLRATIPLKGTAALAGEQLIVELTGAAGRSASPSASPSASRSASRSADGGTLTPWHYGLRFEPVIDGDTGVIRVTSKAPVSEPYVNFVMNVRWPAGSLMREYTLLLEPPAAESAASGRVLQASAAQRQRAAALPAAAAVVTFDSALVTRPGDSLWRLASRLPRPEGTSIHQAMNALYQLNPQAFVGGDPARMRALVPLRAPSADEVAAAPRRLRAPAPLADEAPAAIAHSARAAPAHPGLQGTASEATPAPGNPPAPEARDGSLADQLAGIKAGVAVVESGKLRTRADIDELEQHLQRLVSQYEAMSARARALERQALQRPAAPPPAGTARPALAPAPASADPAGAAEFSLLLSVIGGFGALGYAGGRRLPSGGAAAARQRARSPGAGWRQLLTRFRRARPTGSATYENPHRGPCATALEPAGTAATPRPQRSERELREAILRHPLRSELKLELLRSYAASGQRARFENLARSALAQAPALASDIDALRSASSFAA